jgi:hypothetical protein
MVKLTFKQYRILFLLSILLYVIADQAIAKHYSTAWNDTLKVVIYPINGDSSEQSQQTIHALKEQNFISIKRFIEQQSKHYGLSIDQPVRIKIAPQMNKPPALPALDSGMLSAMIWSLKIRWWAWYENTYTGDKDIRLFVEYYAKESAESQISVGLEKGMMALIKNYADEQLMERNNVIITHEMLHTLGATDKYDPVTLMPSFPQGYAYPELGKNSTQNKCEIMGGRIPYADNLAIVPKSLGYCLIGKTTANEIGWIKQR